MRVAQTFVSLFFYPQRLRFSFSRNKLVIFYKIYSPCRLQYSRALISLTSQLITFCPHAVAGSTRKSASGLSPGCSSRRKTQNGVSSSTH